jgi:hypothetical protein
MKTLRINRLALALAFSLPLFAAVAHADVTQAPTSVWDYQHAVNPATNVHTTGPYDWEDFYRDAHGFPLPGDARIR